MVRPPVAVREAVQAYQPSAGYTLKPPTVTEKSFIFEWGVRVEYIDNDEVKTGWVCLADEACRQAGVKLVLSRARTSRATEHLRKVHRISSKKTAAAVEGKRKRDETVERLLSSNLYRTNLQRLHLLLETLRIVINNLPFCSGEYEESRVIRQVVVREEMQTTINAERIAKAIVELYSSTKAETIDFLERNRSDCANFVIMTDFWTCRTTHGKYLGLRLYLVDEFWQMRSVMLGTQKFSTSYGDRDVGIQGPFSADAGPDAKNLLVNKLKYRWEWCVGHMAHAATKEACGMRNDASKSLNPGMTKLISRIKKTIYQVRTVETTGNLFQELCRTQIETGTTQLLDYNPARFLSLTTAIRRILDKWTAIVAWYDERARKALRENQVPPTFPLQDDQLDLVHLLSLLRPIAGVKRMCQAEEPYQVNVQHALYLIRLNTLDLDKPLKHYMSTKENLKFIAKNELTDLAQFTRERLRKALDLRLCSRYYKTSETHSISCICV
ncbi:hypothetical protein PHYSODRAFT_536340 [Phytophthora sojae]|uniref:Uncharacterized protein n=1 Tax=Phytophthora sojae (strain P6497) TaxID=1094619 RepID=G5AJ36_PHYSP|nr:hypothetical protein PHYSODRAFT_536340 [Phytophthora sojae]EGZ04468.1 hypothetical protein PHYSODRAFT_536340 [Phytophthora sojae]|eukprot:XP_009540087.1 hypothetical protein PHYSODRAFT_536340 [Phytophthora sojae]